MADITITEGDTLEVDYSLENTGDGTGTFDPRLLVQGVQEDQDTGITLDPEQTATGTLQWPTESGDAVTDALAEAVTNDTSDSILVTVEDGVPVSGVFRYEWEQSLTDSWNNNDGVSSGGITYVTDPAVGTYAIQFDGAQDYVDSGVTLDLSNPFSIAYWVKTTDNGNGFDHFWSAFDGSSGPFLQLRDTGIARFRLSSSVTVDTNSAINDGVYRLLTFVWDGSTLEAYVDDANSQGTATGSESGTNNTILFGANGNLSGYQAHTGDDPRLYDKALSASEVSNLYNTGSI